jgi:Xaa-Pro aminopeptidase
MENLRIKKLQEVLPQYKIDGIIITNLTNIRYLTGFTGTAAICFFSQKDAYFLTDSRYTEQAKEQISGARIIKSQDFFKDICKIIEKSKKTRIGIEENNITFGSFKHISNSLRKKKLIGIKGIVEQFRSIKTNEEISYIEKAIDIALSSLEEVLKKINDNISEKEISIELEYQMKKKGGERCEFDFIIASGKRGCLPHGVASNKKIRPGELITFDIGIRYNGYHSDLTRTFAFRKMNEKQKEIYKIVYFAQQAAIREIKSGVSAKYIDSCARKVIESTGYGKYFGHGLGHGIGLNVHELPRLSPKSYDILQENMVVTIEPGIYIPEWGGIRIEDDVVVGKQGATLLSKAPEILKVI